MTQPQRPPHASVNTARAIIELLDDHYEFGRRHYCPLCCDGGELIILQPSENP